MNRACSNTKKCHNPQCDCPPLLEGAHGDGKIHGQVVIDKQVIKDLPIALAVSLLIASILFSIGFFLMHWATA